MEDIKKKRMEILELKDTITKTTTLVDALNSRIERTKERIGELEDRTTEMAQSKQQKVNRKKINKWAEPQVTLRLF